VFPSTKWIELQSFFFFFLYVFYYPTLAYFRDCQTPMARGTSPLESSCVPFYEMDRAPVFFLPFLLSNIGLFPRLCQTSMARGTSPLESSCVPIYEMDRAPVFFFTFFIIQHWPLSATMPNTDGKGNFTFRVELYSH